MLLIWIAIMHFRMIESNKSRTKLSTPTSRNPKLETRVIFSKTPHVNSSDEKSESAKDPVNHANTSYILAVKTRIFPRSRRIACRPSELTRCSPVESNKHVAQHTRRCMLMHRRSSYITASLEIRRAWNISCEKPGKSIAGYGTSASFRSDVKRRAVFRSISSSILSPSLYFTAMA